jgi:DNA-binding MarR family transcriptional regulator
MNDKRKEIAMQFMQLSHIYMHLSRHQKHQHIIKGINPHKGQGRVLHILKMQPEIMQKELGYLLDISTQALAELIIKLEKKGYITRVQSKKDSRSFVIKLTDAGREAIPEINYKTDFEYIEKSFDCLNDEEQENLINYMSRIIKSIEDEVDEDEYITFFRERFFARHKDKHNIFRGFWG